MNKYALISLASLPFILLLLAHYFLPANYLFSSVYKLLYLIPIIYWLKTKSFSEKFSFKSFKKHFFLTLILGLIIFSIYIGVFLIAKNYIDLNLITSSLENLISLNATNIIIIGLYVIIINSLLEEIFWRGFIFSELKTPWLAHFISAFGFALFHSVFFISWFNFYLVALVFFALFIFALIENYILLKTKDLYSCWFIHALADIAQISIGILLFF